MTSCNISVIAINKKVSHSVIIVTALWEVSRMERYKRASKLPHDYISCLVSIQTRRDVRNSADKFIVVYILAGDDTLIVVFWVTKQYCLVGGCHNLQEPAAFIFKFALNQQAACTS
jgi:hypothetical protein